MPKVIWAPEAVETFDSILNYLNENWTKREVTRFIDRVESVIDQVRANPYQYEYSLKARAYRAVLSKHNSLFYRVHEDMIELLIIWDNRQNPEALKL